MKLDKGLNQPENRFTPRGYQQQAHDVVIEGDKKFNKQCIVLPTGSGKTAVAAMWMDTKLPERTLFLAHRENLIDQADRTVREFIGIDAGIEMGKSVSNSDDRVVIGSVASVKNRLCKWPANYFNTIIVDEAHHILSQTYQTVLRHFPDAKVYGITATPDRGDRRNIAEWFENMSFEVSMVELINAGWLCPVSVLALPVKIDLGNVTANKSAGTLHEGQSHQTLTPLLRNIAEQLKVHAGDRKTMAFLPLVKTSKEFTRICNEVGLNAMHVDGQMNDYEKKEVKKWFRKTESGVLCNSMICTEGFDEPSVSAICCLRFCTSRPLLQQIVGRGMRVHESKKDCLVLDFLYQHEVHPLVRPSDLFSDSEEVSRLMTKKSHELGKSLNLIDLEEEASRDVAEARKNKLAADLLSKANRQARRIDPMMIATGYGNLEIVDYEPIFKWEKDPVTDDQRNALEGFGINSSMVTCKGQASVIIKWMIDRRKKNLPTPKQWFHLVKNHHPNPTEVSFKQATAWLGQRFKKFEEWNKRKKRKNG